jgi:transposase
MCTPGLMTLPIRSKHPSPARQARAGRRRNQRLGVCNILMAREPLAGWRLTQVTERRTKTDWAHFIEDIASSDPQAQRITLVMDSLSTHTLASLYEAFAPDKAKALWDRFEFIHTPKHGPELHRIEKLWWLMKRRWMALTRRTKVELEQTVNHILTHFGSQFKMAF